MCKSPEQPCGKKSVVEALVGRQHFGLCGEIGGQLEGFVAARGVPQEHFQSEDVDVDGTHGAGGDLGEQGHCLCLPLSCLVPELRMYLKQSP